jgi:phosphate transport system protein
VSHFEQRLERDVRRIRDEVARLGEVLDAAVEASVRALAVRDRRLAYETILRDQGVNRRVKAIDKMCHSFVVRHLPSAGHLRFVSSVLRINIALERVGDYAVTICREAARLSRRPWGAIRRDMDLLVVEARASLGQSLKAFVSENADLARGTHETASVLGRSFDQVFSDLIEEGDRANRPIADLFALLVVINRLSRICDQAQNICEETIFVATGEEKRGKKFRILFVDSTDSRWSQLARAMGRKAYEGRAVFASAGWSPASHLDSEFAAFMSEHGYDPGDSRPNRMEPTLSFLGDFDILIGLEGDLRERIEEVPYHSIVLSWRLEGVASLEEGYRRLTMSLSDLMGTLSGEAVA